MQRWIIMIGCLLLWQADGMAEGKKRMPAAMAKKVAELNAQAEASYEKGEYDGALELVREILVIRERYLGSEHPDAAESLNNIAVLYWAKGNYERALPLYERALAILEKALGPAHPDVASSLNNLAELYRAKGDYERALPLLERALVIREKALGPAHPDVATSLNALAALHHDKGDYERPLPLLERALAIREKALGPEHPNVTVALNNLAALHKAKRDYDHALPLLERALTIGEKALGPAHPAVATLLNNLAGLHEAKGDYERALPLHERALAIREKALGPAHPDVAESLNNIAGLYGAKGDYERALALYEQALAILETALGPAHSNVAASLNNIAWLYGAKGDYERALSLYERALAIWEKVLGPDHPHVATSLYNLAELYRTKGDYERALPLIERALTIREKVLGSDHLRVAAVFNTFALLHDAKGDYERALPLFERALAILEKALGTNHPDVATSLNNLAGLHDAKGDYERAQPLYERALAIREKALGPAHPDVAQSLNNLAALHDATGDYERARLLSERALAILEKALGPAHPDVAQSLNNLAMVHYTKGDYERALPLQERALAITQKALGPAHPHIAISLNNLAWIHWARGKTAEANLYFRRAEGAREAHLELTIGVDSERGKRMYLARLAGDVDGNLVFALQTSHPDSTRLAFTKMLRRKGRVLGSMTTTFAAVRRHPDARVQALWDEYRSNRTQYATQLVRGPGKIPPEQHRKNLDTLQERATELERLLGDKSRKFRDEQTPITVEAVQAALPRDAALVEWIRYQPFDPKARHEVKPLRYAACVLLAVGPPRCLDLGDARAIDEDVKELRNALGRNLVTLPQGARRLEARIMAPVRAYLGDISRVYLSPDGPLHLIPFAALRDEHGRYLVERYTFTYLTTGRELMHRATSERASSQVLITANPAHGEPVPGQREAFSFAPLPAAGDEAATVAAMFREPRVLQGADASEALVKQARGPLIWHHIGHAHYSPLSCTADAESPDDPRLQSALAMAGANVCRDGDDDGLLTAVEVAGLDLGGTKLVVLSACESGVGATSLGDTQRHVADGVYGLRRALVMAGSETQVMSLWRVEDRIARSLMEAYYHNLLAQGMGRSEALRQVQLAWLKSGDVYASPYYWAAFVVSGNDAPLDAGSSSTVPRVQRSPRGCACDASPDLGQGSGIALLLGLVLVVIRYRRKTGLSAQRSPDHR